MMRTLLRSGPDVGRTAPLPRTGAAAPRTVETCATTVALTAHSPAAAAGLDRPGAIAFVVEGYLRRHCLHSDGRAQTTALLMPGDLIEGVAGAQGRFTLETATDVRLLVLAPERARRWLAQDPAAARALAAMRAAKIAQTRWLADALARLTAEERVVSFLVLATRWMPFQPVGANSGLLTMDLPRQDWANLLATTVETICRVLGRLDRAGLVSLLGAQGFLLRDIGALCHEGRMAADWRALPLARIPSLRGAPTGIVAPAQGRDAFATASGTAACGIAIPDHIATRQ